MATGDLGGSSVRADLRTIRRCVDWLLAHDQPIEEQWWEELHKQATTARSPRDRRHAIEALASRVDPVPKPALIQAAVGELTLVWASESKSPTPLAPSSNGSMTPSPPIILEHRSSSATDDLENL